MKQDRIIVFVLRAAGSVFAASSVWSFWPVRFLDFLWWEAWAPDMIVAAVLLLGAGAIAKDGSRYFPRRSRHPRRCSLEVVEADRPETCAEEDRLERDAYRVALERISLALRMPGAPDLATDVPAAVERATGSLKTGSGTRRPDA